MSTIQNRKVFRGASLLVLTSALIAPGTALAQAATVVAQAQATSTSGQGLEEVVVTAQKRRQNANDVGITLNVFTGKELADKGVATPEDMALYTPGLTVNATAATGVPNYTIRGVGFQDYSTGASSTVGLYFDGVAIPYAVMSRGPLFDLKRVEVLKGPQGDLYGQNTTAGQINFISNLPTDDFAASLRVGYSSYQTVDIEGYIGGPLTKGIDGRLAFTTTQSGEGWQQSLTRPNDHLGKKDIYAIRAMLDIDLGRGDLLLKAQYNRDLSDNQANTAYDGRIIGLGQFNNPYAQILPYAASGNAPWYSTGNNTVADWTNNYTDPSGKTYNLRPRTNSKLLNLTATLNYDLGHSVTITSVTGYDGFDRRDANDWDGTPANDSSNINTSDIKVYSEELRLSGSADRLNWVAGLYYSYDKVNEIYHYFMSDSVYGLGGVAFGVAPFMFAPILQLHTQYSQETTSKAAFAHVEYNITDALQVVGGLRYTDETRSWSGCTFDAGDGSLANFLNFAFGTSLGPGACGTIDDNPGSPDYIFSVIGTPNVNNAFHVYNQTIRDGEWMYKLGANYKVTDAILAYATFGHGFKSGGFNGANSNTTSQLQAYKPEELNSYELGLKSTLLDHTLQFNLAGFYYDYKNKQESDLAVTFVGNISGITNVPKSRIYGAEADVTWAPVDGLLMNLGAAWLDTRVTDWQAVSNASHWPAVVRFDAAGMSLAQAPKWEFNGNIEYEKPISSALKAGIGIDIAYKDSTSGGAQGIAYATADYTVANARLTLANIDDKWSLMLWSRNLFDTYYYPAAYVGGNGPYVRTVGMPRTIGVTAQYRF
ncbi:MAG: TonB-dependent receptor [Alphaproteobacteria bacterium]|nr:TonB-dependent receptor [Alphaproteobacteria bacterium]